MEPTHHENVEELDDNALELAAGGGGGGPITNSTEIVYASTFIPFDSSF